MLRKGSVGSNVESWQVFLRGLRSDSDVVVSGTFDETTHVETVMFQRANGLVADGIVGPATLRAAMTHDYPEAYDPDMVPSLPKNPGIKNLTPTERSHIFGSFSYVPAGHPNNPEAIKITDGWAIDNIKMITVPQLIGIPGASRNGMIQIHAKIADQTLALFQAWEDAGLTDRILSWDGSWVPRFIRGSRTSLSNHSWGTAFDINARWNGLGVVPPTTGRQGSVVELVRLADAHGFYWGGWFPRRPDGMHFECYKVL